MVLTEIVLKREKAGVRRDRQKEKKERMKEQNNSDPEDHLSGPVPKARVEKETIKLFHSPLQKHSLHLFTRRAAPEKLVKHLQGLYHLNKNAQERGIGLNWGGTCQAPPLQMLFI